MSKFASIIFALLAPLAAVAEEKVLHVYNWVDHIGATTLRDFEQATGIKVTYDVYDSNDVLQGKLLAGNSGFDIVVPSSGFLARMISAGVFLPLDRDKLSNLTHMDPVLMKKLQSSDPGNRHAVPYLWGTTGIGINRQQVERVLGKGAPVDSWALVFNKESMSKLSSCGVAFVDAFDEVFPAVLAAEGKDPMSGTTDVFLKDVVPVLESVSQYVTYYHSSKYINDLANGDICVAVGWSGDVIQAAERAREANRPFDIEYHLPKEGSTLWFDMLAIPVDAPHPDNAHQFINFLMTPEVIAEVTNTVRYANANQDATDFIAPEILANPAIYPSAETNDKNYTVPPYPPKVDREGLRMWTRLKTGR